MAEMTVNSINSNTDAIVFRVLANISKDKSIRILWKIIMMPIFIYLIYLESLLYLR